MREETVPGSFRDPSGFLFVRDGILYRQVNRKYSEDYDLLMQSGLYGRLVDSGLLVSHEEAPLRLGSTGDAYKVIRPQLVPFISYPYEWCFSQMKDAAVLTLKIQKIAIEHGMSLKDASSYNVQFENGKPVFIDTLSFERYKEGSPWVAYRQFCQHFLAPVALMAYIDPRIAHWMKVYIDGIPLDLASSLLPSRTRLRFNMLTHLHLHARAQKRFDSKVVKKNGGKVSKMAVLGFVDGLMGLVSSLKWDPRDTEWGDYYNDTNYTDGAHGNKKQLVSDFLDALRPKKVWDFGANDGMFSRIACGKGMEVVSFDVDIACVEKNYKKVRKNGEANILPLLTDTTNPSPGIGWNNRERLSLTQRGPCDTLMALALIHHLAISNNVPLAGIANYFSGICRSLIIEWVPKEDSQVQRLLATREDIFDNYTRQSFELDFSKYFEINARKNIEGSKRVLYMMRNLSEF